MAELQADYLATGHYVRLAPQGERFILRRAVCAEKDQSYFMYRIPQHILNKCLFPLGEYTKEQVRAIAEKHHLASARQKDSYDICFIESGNYRQCLGQVSNNYLTPGDIIDKTGRIVGQHQGLANYTIGQRRGIEVALGYPAYVVALDMVNNQLVLGEKADLLTTKAQVEALTFLPFERLASPIEAQVKIRYQAEPVSATIIPDDQCPGCADIIFERPVWAVTPGQSAVIYDGETLIGGGYLL